MKTYTAKPDQLTKKWFVIDLEGKNLGRVAATVASILRGKHRPTYTPHCDAGDFVIVVNADKVELTGAKADKKMYYRHSLYPGGIKSNTAKQLLGKHPDDLFRLAVRGMLPKNPLGRKMLKKLKIYTGAEHPHQAQKPETLAL